MIASSLFAFLTNTRTKWSGVPGCMPPRQTLARTHPVPKSRAIAPLNEDFASRLALHRIADNAGDPSLPPVALSAPQSAPFSSSSAFHPPRSDGTVVHAYGRGSKRKALQVAADPEALQTAVRTLTDGVYSNSNKGPQALKLQTWIDIARDAGHRDPFRIITGIII